MRDASSHRNRGFGGVPCPLLEVPRLLGRKDGAQYGWSLSSAPRIAPKCRK